MNGKTGRDLAIERRQQIRKANDLQMHLYRGCCPGCGQASALSGGTGCTCRKDGFQLAMRCLTNAERAAQSAALRSLPRPRPPMDAW